MREPELSGLWASLFPLCEKDPEEVGINVSGGKQKGEFISELLKGERMLVSRLRQGELDEKTVGALLTRINTGVVTLVQDALDDKDLAEELVRALEKAIKDRITVAPPVVTTLGKTLAMRHDLEFNGHSPSEQELRENLAGLKIALEQLEGEKRSNMSRRDGEKIGRSKENQRDNTMFR